MYGLSLCAAPGIMLTAYVAWIFCNVAIVPVCAYELIVVVIVVNAAVKISITRTDVVNKDFLICIIITTSCKNYLSCLTALHCYAIEESSSKQGIVILSDDIVSKNSLNLKEYK
jgi:hypothetical protein